MSDYPGIPLLTATALTRQDDRLVMTLATMRVLEARLSQAADMIDVLLHEQGQLSDRLAKLETPPIARKRPKKRG